MKLKKAVQLVKKHKPYCLRDDSNISKKRRKKSKKFHDKWGFNYEDCWSLDHSIACFILPRLVHFKEVKCGYPGTLTPEEWDKILDKMIKAFRIVVKDETLIGAYEDEKKVEEGLNLFAKYFLHLWD